jgi:Flp pilus assembly protein TadG
MSIRKLRSYLLSRRGAGTAEFAMVLPALIALTFGIIHFGIIMYAETTLHAAAEAAARCASINLNTSQGATTCLTSDTIQAYAAAHYAGPQVSQTFTYSQPSCGNLVVATGTYKMNIVVANLNIGLSAQSCYP